MVLRTTPVGKGIVCRNVRTGKCKGGQKYIVGQ